MSSEDRAFHFKLAPQDALWAWSILEGQNVVASGAATTRALAAAMIIREICRRSRSPIAAAADLKHAA